MATAKQVAVVIIGDEILEGTTVDRNAALLIEWAAGQGHRITSVQIIGDSEPVIIRALQRARADGAECIVTTGGVGPTIDDLTVQAVGRSQGMMDDVELPDMLTALRSWIGDEPQGVRRRTALAPKGTSVVFPKRDDSKYGWPAFVVGDTTCLPGIPRLVEILIHLLPQGPGRRPFAKLSFEGRETQGAEPMEQVAAQFPDLSFGSYPPTREPKDRVSLTVRGDDPERVALAAQALLDALEHAGLSARREGASS
jgi:molybdenum cofactor synthesis domain-containing protein